MPKWTALCFHKLQVYTIQVVGTFLSQCKGFIIKGGTGTKANVTPCHLLLTVCLFGHTRIRGGFLQRCCLPGVFSLFSTQLSSPIHGECGHWMKGPTPGVLTLHVLQEGQPGRLWRARRIMVQLSSDLQKNLSHPSNPKVCDQLEYWVVYRVQDLCGCTEDGVLCSSTKRLSRGDGTEGRVLCIFRTLS